MSLVDLYKQHQPEIPRLLAEIITGPVDDAARRIADRAVAPPPPPPAGGEDGETAAAPPAAPPRLRVAVLPFDADAAARDLGPLALLPSELLRAHLATIESLNVTSRAEVRHVLPAPPAKSTIGSNGSLNGSSNGSGAIPPNARTDETDGEKDDDGDGDGDGDGDVPVDNPASEADAEADGDDGAGEAGEAPAPESESATATATEDAPAEAAAQPDAEPAFDPVVVARQLDAPLVLHGRVRVSEANADQLELTIVLTEVPEDEGAEAVQLLLETVTAAPAEVVHHLPPVALRVIRHTGMPARAAELEKTALPITDSADAAHFWARAILAESAGDLATAVRCGQLALDERPSLRPIAKLLAGLLTDLVESESDAVAALREPIRRMRQFRGISRQLDPSLDQWLVHRPLAERDDFSALAFANEGMMGQGLDALMEALLELPANGTVLRLATGMLESHLCREDTPLPEHYVQWQMPLDHPANRVLYEREQKRAWLTLTRARAELAVGHVEDARALAKLVIARFPHLEQFVSYANEFLADLDNYSEDDFQKHRRDSARRFERQRQSLELLWARDGLGEITRQSPSATVRHWQMERPALSWDTFARDWETFNVFSRQPQPPLFPLDPDDTETELLDRLAAERQHAVTPVGQRLATRPLAWLGSRALARLRQAADDGSNDPARLTAAWSGLVRAGEAPTAEDFERLVAADPLAAARFVRSLTPAVTSEAPGHELEVPPIRPERPAAARQAMALPDGWRPVIWKCIAALPKSASVEAAHLIAVLGRNPQEDEEQRFLDAIAVAPEDAAIALLELKSTGLPIDAGFPADQPGWCLAWRARFKEQGPAALIHLLPEGPGWMTVLGKQLADLVPLAMMAPTRLAGEVSKRRAERGYPEKDMLYIEELASGALSADERPQSAKVATIILQQIIQRWPPWDLSLGDHVWLFGTLERIENEEDPDALKVILELGRKTFEEFGKLEPREFDEADIARERYYSDEQLLLVEILKRVVVSLEGRDSQDARDLLRDIICSLQLPAQGHLIPFVESAIIAQGPYAIQMIESWLEQPDACNVGAAHRILRTLRGPVVDDRLVNWVGQDHAVRQHVAFETLRQRGTDAADLISRMLLSPAANQQIAACELLARIRPGGLPDDFDFSPLAGILAETHNRRALRAASVAAGVHGVEAAFQPVAERLVNWPVADRAELLDAAARTGGMKACPFLIRALQSEHADEIQCAWSHLLRVTGQTFACEPAPWAMWWVTNTDDMSLPRPKEAARPREAMKTIITQMPGAFTSEIHEPSQTILDIESLTGGGGLGAPLSPEEAKKAAAAADKAKAAVEEAMRRRREKEATRRSPTAKIEEPAPQEDLPPVTALELEDSLPPADAMTSFVSVEFTRDKKAEVFDSQALSRAMANDMFDIGDDTPPDDDEDDAADLPDEVAPAVDLDQLDDLDDMDMPESYEMSGQFSNPGMAPTPSAAISEDAVALPDMVPASDPFGGANEDPFQGLGESKSFAMPGMATSLNLPNPNLMPHDEYESINDEYGMPAAAPADAYADDTAYDLPESVPVMEAVPESVPMSAGEEQALIDETLLGSPVNDVAGTFPLASLHGNGVGQWISTNPDRFESHGPVWFLIGGPEVDRYNFHAPFHIVEGGFDLVLGPHEGGGFQVLRIDSRQYEPNQWWTLMVERAGEHCWFRIAERDHDWHTLHGRVEVEPLAAVGISFIAQSDVAFGDLLFEPQEKAPMVSQILGRRGGPRRR